MKDLIYNSIMHQMRQISTRIGLQFRRLPQTHTSISMFVAILMSLVALLVSCDKALFDAGDTVTKEIAIDGPVSSINIQNIFDIVLVQDTVNKVLVTCGENLQSYVSITAQDGVLTLNHSVKNSWSRKYEKIKLEVHLITISKIDIHEPVSLKTSGVFKCDNFVLTDFDKVSEVDVNLDVTFCGIYMSSDNYGYFKVKGKAQSADIWGWGSAYVKADSLVAQNCSVLHRGMADVYVNVTGKLSVSLEFSGDVYYTGNPTEIVIVEQLSSGRLIKMD
jgi:hypothetical protein